MNLPSAKDLAALAKACRKAGIASIKYNGLEITLGESAPSPRRPAAKKQVDNSPEDLVADDEMLNPEDALYWSTGEAAPQGGSQ